MKHTSHCKRRGRQRIHFYHSVYTCLAPFPSPFTPHQTHHRTQPDVMPDPRPHSNALNSNRYSAYHPLNAYPILYFCTLLQCYFFLLKTAFNKHNFVLKYLCLVVSIEISVICHLLFEFEVKIGCEFRKTLRCYQISKIYHYSLECSMKNVRRQLLLKNLVVHVNTC